MIAVSGSHRRPRRPPTGLAGHDGAQSIHYRPLGGRFGDPKPIVHEGRYHVFFQTSPRPDGFDTMRWGHVVSRDLLRWTPQPAALEPEAGGPDGFGCWTGCVLRVEDRFHAFYTGVGGPDGRQQTVCHAESDDLIVWRKDPANPLVVPAAPFATGPTAAWRDPQLRRLPDGGFEMVLTAELPTGPKALRACIARLLSDDLRNWRVDRVLHRPADVHRCECPEVVPLDDVFLLLYSDYGVQVRQADAPEGPYRRPSITQFDDFRWYAAKTATDGERRLVFGFVFDRLATAQAPRKSGPSVRRATPSFVEEPDDGSPWTWGGVMAFPRELALDAEGGPALRPIDELRNLRQRPCPLDPDVAGAVGEWRIDSAGDGCAYTGRPRADAEELAFLSMGRQEERFEVAFRASWSRDGVVGLVLYADEEIGIGYRLDLDRRRGDLTLRRLVPHSNPASPVLQRMPLPLDLSDEVEVRALVDGSLIEVFVARRVAFTGRTYQRPRGATWGVTTRGPATFHGVRAWRLARPAAPG